MEYFKGSGAASARELAEAGVEPRAGRIKVTAGPVIDMSVGGGEPIKKKKRWKY